jgi:hypothetical protein
MLMLQARWRDAFQVLVPVIPADPSLIEIFSFRPKRLRSLQLTGAALLDCVGKPFWKSAAGPELWGFGVSALTFFSVGKSHCLSFITYLQESVQAHNKRILDLRQLVRGRKGL